MKYTIHTITFVDGLGIEPWNHQILRFDTLDINMCRGAIDIRNLTGTINGKVIGHHDMNITYNYRRFISFTNGAGYENDITYGYGMICFEANGEVIIATDVADVTNIAFINLT